MDEQAKKTGLQLEHEKEMKQLVKGFGGFACDTSNMSALMQSVSEEQAEWLVYVMETGQATHIQFSVYLE